MRTITFDGHVLTDDFVASQVVRPRPRPVADTVRVGGRDGVALRGVNYDPIEISMLLVATGGTPEERRGQMRTLSGWLAAGVPKKLEFGDDSGLCYMAVPNGGMEAAEYIDADTISVSFLVPDPAMYGAAKTATVPSGGSASVTVGGTYPTRPRISASSAVRNSSSLVWGVRLNDGDFIHVQTGSAYSRAVSIDCDARTCAVAGSAKLPTLDSDWLELTPGTHVISNDQGTGACTVSWVERWL